ncbi:MAG: cupin domain-containing protein [Desulfatitalea sp.]|nr:cupin domain-containing protein [Desulfatitalea sp.]NNJ99994.1 cupin domain-containing protein [Desulfatitalea sp.]
MLVSNKKNSNKGNYAGLSTNLLIGELNSGSKEISIQTTDVQPKEMQPIHSHEEEQCYYIISGSGMMLIDEQRKEVKEGDAIFIPSNSKHGIINIAEQVLTYLTANKAFGKKREAEIWPDKPAL